MQLPSDIKFDADYMWQNATKRYQSRNVQCGKPGLAKLWRNISYDESKNVIIQERHRLECANTTMCEVTQIPPQKSWQDQTCWLIDNATPWCVPFQTIHSEFVSAVSIWFLLRGIIPSHTPWIPLKSLWVVFKRRRKMMSIDMIESYLSPVLVAGKVWSFLENLITNSGRSTPHTSSFLRYTTWSIATSLTWKWSSCQDFFFTFVRWNTSLPLTIAAVLCAGKVRSFLENLFTCLCWSAISAFSFLLSITGVRHWSGHCLLGMSDQATRYFFPSLLLGGTRLSPQWMLQRWYLFDNQS